MKARTHTCRVRLAWTFLLRTLHHEEGGPHCSSAPLRGYYATRNFFCRPRVPVPLMSRVALYHRGFLEDAVRSQIHKHCHPPTYLQVGWLHSAGHRRARQHGICQPQELLPRQQRMDGHIR